MNNLIFVYGTLRRDEANHQLLQDADYCGSHVTTPCYRMLHLGAYPGVVEGGSTAIVGEIYRIGKKGLVDLDRLEAYPTLYIRKLIPSPVGKMWIYLYRGHREGRAVIASGDWTGQSRQFGPFSLY